MVTPIQTQSRDGSDLKLRPFLKGHSAAATEATAINVYAAPDTGVSSSGRRACECAPTCTKPYPLLGCANDNVL